MIAIDVGNTRIKWGVYDGSSWSQRGNLLTAEVTRIGEVAAAWPEGDRVIACNVAGEPVRDQIDRRLSARFSAISWLRSDVESCGVRNGYDLPERLGADRWAALIGARGHTDRACLVVCAGTATTADWLDADGNFRGGVILPGMDLMLASLARDTAQLPLAEGEFRLAPRNTGDAIVSGCLHAQVGAIERMFAAVASEPSAKCLLTGGASPRIARHLSIPFQLMENLILDGLVRFGMSR
ncbi:type III pantothenate kinase [Propionivibrio soli]|uniref:type III pantothenate kinase n=1 Tax=Propionivibrio soli TaxID=2976531 RepID=UPI0023E02614|nr:type III pantothenate kinase [Propionivibrio soli]